MNTQGFGGTTMYFAYVIRLASGLCRPYKVFTETEAQAGVRVRAHAKELGVVAQIHKVGTAPHEPGASAQLYERACRRAEILESRHAKKEENVVDK